MTEWMVPTAGLLLNPGRLLHVKGVQPPRINTPTTVRGRYINGTVREAGPGSTIGRTLCGTPMGADELWVRADSILSHMVKHHDCGCFGLCGPCSYWSGCPTIHHAIEKRKP